ncbi:MAG: sigma-70 family RNA polymerase sigma factor [Chloroflexota bacterium]|nr:sigma-70 family RNA polymerase sigma factor [Chloroflexota bacterium]
MRPKLDYPALYDACHKHGSDEQREALTAIWNDFRGIAMLYFRQYPDCDQIASDCAQDALIKLHKTLNQCHGAASFKAWSHRILLNTIKDKGRSFGRERRVDFPDESHPQLSVPAIEPPGERDLKTFLLDVITSGPLSARSRRVIIGRFFEERKDEDLARVEAQLSGDNVSPGNIQSTRAKNIDKLRHVEGLVDYLRDFLD